MSNSSFPEPTEKGVSLPPRITLIQSTEKTGGFLGWWHGLTAPARPAADASFLIRETYRKAQLFSTVDLFLIVLLCFFMPATFFMNAHVPYLCGSLIVCGIIALFVNRVGLTIVASLMLVIGCEIVLSCVILFTRPMDATIVQLYDLFIIIELVAVSLLPVRSVFLLALLHSGFICWHLLFFGPWSAEMAALIETQLLPVLVRPVGLQFMVAGVIYIWVRNALAANERANRAEMIAKLENTVVHQRATIEQEKQVLEESIQQLVKAHVDVTQGQLAGRIPYPPAKSLWPLVGVLNTLWVRLQRSQQGDMELKQLKQAIVKSAEYLQNGVTPDRMKQIPRTGTELDQLLLAIKPASSTPLDKRNERGPFPGGSR